MIDVCYWCEPPTNTNSIVKEHVRGRLVWKGCIDCYKKREELKNNAAKV